LSFVTLVFSNVLLILTNLSWKDNFLRIMEQAHRTFWWVCAGALGVMTITLYTPFFRGVFHFGILHLKDLGAAFTAGALSPAWFEMLKFAQRER